MLKLTEEEITILLEINKKIIYNTNVKWKKHITSILKIANREHYLANREPKKLTSKNKEEKDFTYKEIRKKNNIGLAITSYFNSSYSFILFKSGNFV